MIQIMGAGNDKVMKQICQRVHAQQNLHFNEYWK